MAILSQYQLRTLASDVGRANLILQHLAASGGIEIQRSQNGVGMRGGRLVIWQDFQLVAIGVDATASVGSFDFIKHTTL